MMEINKNSYFEYIVSLMYCVVIVALLAWVDKIIIFKRHLSTRRC